MSIGSTIFSVVLLAWIWYFFWYKNAKTLIKTRKLQFQTSLLVAPFARWIVPTIEIRFVTAEYGTHMVQARAFATPWWTIDTGSATRHDYVKNQFDEAVERTQQWLRMDKDSRLPTTVIAHWTGNKL